MDFFEKLNKKLDEGYKLTDYSCPICKKSVVFNPSDKSLFCIGCNLPIKFEGEIIDKEDKSKQVKQGEAESNSASKNESEDYEIIKKDQKSKEQSKSDEISNKLSKKLLQGWGMLEESCGVCYTPIMRSKAGEHVCVNCGWTKMIDPKSQKTLAQVLDEEKFANQKKQDEEKFNAQKKQDEDKKNAEKAENDQKQQNQLQQQQTTQNNQQQQQNSVQNYNQNQIQYQQQQTSQQQQPQQIAKNASMQQLDEQFYNIMMGNIIKQGTYIQNQIDQSIQCNTMNNMFQMFNDQMKQLIEMKKQLNQSYYNQN